MFSTLGGNQTLLGHLQLFRQLPRGAQTTSSSSSSPAPSPSSTAHSRSHRRFAPPRNAGQRSSAAPVSTAAAGSDVLAPHSMDSVLQSLERSGGLGDMIRQCRSEMEPALEAATKINLGIESPPATGLPSLQGRLAVGGTPLSALPPAAASRPALMALLNSALFSRTLNNVQVQLVRGFRSHRYSDGGIPFRKTRTEQPEETDSSFDKQEKTTLDDFIQKLSRIDQSDRQQTLSKEDRARVLAALQEFAAGQGEDKKGTKSKAVSSSILWDKINKLASLLIIIAIIISLMQIFNIPILRTNKGANEISPEDIDVTFDDVRGCDEAKQELTEIVDFLTNPEKYSALGGKLPKGCLLVGPPGTGKTLLARAVAGQAGVPFFHATGSEFDEVLVGQGARRVRDLFRAAKQRAPCVIFIDEIDTVGSKRTSSVLHPYANQTINQLLSEMDGFVSNEGVIVLGATNRAEELDKALLRPGRFDTQVTVPKPDMKGRRDILELYLDKIKHDDSVEIEKLAKMTVGFSGADLENMVNMAAIRAAVDGKDLVAMSEFEYSHDKHVLGTDWKSRVRDQEDLRITAYHEAGHTLVAYFTKDAQPLHKVTIVAKGQSGGHTALLPERDSYHETRSQYYAQMDVSMGGRAAEELIFGLEKVTGGASADLQSATGIAEVMVKKLGMSSKIGLRVFASAASESGLSAPSELGPGTMELIDAEVNRMLDESYKRAADILRKHRSELDLLAEALLNYETLDADDIRAIIGAGGGKTSDGLKAVHHRLSQKNSLRLATSGARGEDAERPPPAPPGYKKGVPPSSGKGMEDLM